jgi:hypothetical protein
MTILYNNIIVYLAGMGVSGCLGPRKTKGEIYIELITKMHEEIPITSASE